MKEQDLFNLVLGRDNTYSLAPKKKGIEWKAVGMFALIIIVIAAWVLLA